jgi:hypothetical protein
MADALLQSETASTIVHVQTSYDSELTNLLHRLEAATSRLEDIATSSTTPENSPPHPSAATTNGLATRSQELLNSPNAGASRAPSTPSLSLPKSEPLPAEIGDFDTLIKGDLAAFVKLSENLDPLLAQQVSLHWILVCDQISHYLWIRQKLSIRRSSLSVNSSSFLPRRRNPTWAHRNIWTF